VPQHLAELPADLRERAPAKRSPLMAYVEDRWGGGPETRSLYF